jgi:hypothetical protein
LSLPEVERLSVTTVVDTLLDRLRADERIAKRFTHAQMSVHLPSEVVSSVRGAFTFGA